MSIHMGGLARRLVSDKLIDEAQALAAMESAAEAKVAFVSQLVSSHDLDSYAIALAASEEFGAPLLDLDAFDFQHTPANLVDARLIRKHNVLPLLKRPNRLYLAVSDPANIEAFDEIKFAAGVSVEAIVVEEDKLARAIGDYLDKEEESGAALGDLDDIALDDLDIVDPQQEEEPEESSSDETPIVRFVNKVLLDAIRTGASDIHVEPYEKSYRVRFRTDGILHEVTRPPINIASRIASRIKIMSQMDISEKRVPQDGRIKMKVSKTRAIDFRVNTLPTLWGEKIVLRILDPSSAQMGIDALGYEDGQKALYMQALHQHQGLILVTGPTGSGKTVSLYTGLNILNTPERNISTAEDPVEINLEGINQVHVNTKVGLGFAPEGHKQVEGDGKTPEGTYVINRHNPNSRYHLSIGISYPNNSDRRAARDMGKSPGGDIFIHGEPRAKSERKRAARVRDWTAAASPSPMRRSRRSLPW